ncbi:MAG: biotin--[acetyl-CoA-carboxylase] ligase [Desulfobacterales bacterium]|jgi:BirA family biotin operon repressor/biotin-[acetyl-CoA-carboxylase] ligase
MKGKILNILRFEKGIVSGETLSASLGISRVSIWKHIQKLSQLGYQIQTTPKGYQLMKSPDIPFSWELPGREANVHYFDEVTSTMEIAKDLAHKGCPNFTVVIAGCQKKGRGRLDRDWVSDPGGLYFTVVLRPQIPVILSSRLNFLASITLARIFREAYEVDARVKWPNDILVNDRKISGMLTEVEAEADRVNFINIGIGINVNNDPSRSVAQASSLKKILGKQISRKELLSRFLDEFESGMQQVNFDCIVSEWKKFTVTLNRHVRIITNQETSEGLAVDVDDNGGLILKMDDGSLKKILYGDCFHLK